ncbi:MAG: AraC family transcriptional regulator [Bacteroidales bacterium]|nr:AraC family transcriptional regulator [Bacteroidales bacterium]
MSNHKKTLLQSTDKITEIGVSAIEVTDMPMHNIPYISPHYIISICHKGSIDVEYDSKAAKFCPRDIAIVYPQHSLITHNVSPDYEASLIVISSDIYSKLGKLNMGHMRYVYEQLPHFHLTDSQYETIMSIVNAIRHITSIDIESREDILISGIYTLTQIIDYFHDVSVGPSDATNKRLSLRFPNAVIENCMQHRDVNFYADLFCLTPKHFSQVVKEQTGHTASYWIQQFVIRRAKEILTYEIDASVQSISDRFGFPSQASFCRYFKRGTGISPTQYRDER